MTTRRYCEICGARTWSRRGRCSKHLICFECGVGIPRGRTCEGCRTRKRREASVRYYERHAESIRTYHREYRKTWRAKSSDLPKPELVERRCLKCNKHFQAEGRFNRICLARTEGNEKVHDFGPRYRVLRQP